MTKSLLYEKIYDKQGELVRKLVIIPAYNEENNILEVVNEVMANSDKGTDLLVVNDCSNDNTRVLLEENHVPHINLSVNLGIGGAVQAGYRYALANNYDIAIQIDGDGQHDSSFLSSIIGPIENNTAEICIGSRFIDKNGFQSSRARRTGIKVLSLIIYLCTRTKIYDVTSGFRAAGKRAIGLYANNYPQDYPEPEAIVMAVNRGYSIQEVPVLMRERKSGNSSITTFKSLYYMIKVSLAILIERMRGK